MSSSAHMEAWAPHLPGGLPAKAHSCCWPAGTRHVWLAWQRNLARRPLLQTLPIGGRWSFGMKQAAALYGQVHGVANCVGSLVLKPSHLLSEEEWDATIATNLKSAFAVVRAATGVMTPQGGSIVLLSTAAARIGLANHEAISAAKAGVEGLALAAAALDAAKGSGHSCSPGNDPHGADRQAAAERNDGQSFRRHARAGADRRARRYRLGNRLVAGSRAELGDGPSYWCGRRAVPNSLP